MHLRALAAGATALAAIPLTLTACHQAPADVCAVYQPHTGDTITFAAWDPPYSDGIYGGRYLCSYRHPDGGTHHICVYPPEHYPPPDDVWAKTDRCAF